MKKSERDNSSPFKGVKGIEYFDFEEDFVEQNVRCIPMIVRFKMDQAGIKLKLAQWSKFSIEERKKLALMACITAEDTKPYHRYLAELIYRYTGDEATYLPIDKNAAWTNTAIIPEKVQEKAKEFNCTISVDHWKLLTTLQRFALLKLCRPGHENRSFPKALKEFGLLK